MNETMNGTPIHLKAVNLEESSKRSRNECYENAAHRSLIQEKMERCSRDPLFLKCVDLIPNAYIRKGDGEEAIMDEPTQRFHLAFLRWNDPICNKCWKKGNGVRLSRCSCCGLVTYCSKECQKAEWKAHREYVRHLPETPVPWPRDPFTPVIYELPHAITKKKLSFDVPGENTRTYINMN